MFHSLGLALLLLSAGCSGGKFGGAFSKDRHDDTDEVEAKAPTDSEKPTDNSEGVPGYLTSPDIVVSRQEGDSIVLTAPADAIAAESGALSDVVVNAWSVAKITGLSDLLKGADGTLGTKLASAKPGADGSLSMTVPVPGSGVLVLTIGAHSSVPGLVNSPIGSVLLLQGLRPQAFSVFDGFVVAAGYTRIAAGADHFCALSNAGVVSCWGRDAHGALGDGAGLADRSEPKPIDVEKLADQPGIRTFVDIDSGSYGSCAVNAAGEAWCWGYDAGGALGGGPVAPDKCGIDRCALTPQRVKTDGMPPADRRFRKVSLAATQACGLSSGGALYCWGSDVYGNLGNGPGSTADCPDCAFSPVAVDVSATGESKFVDIGVGSTGACAIGASGKLFCWGLDVDGELGNGAGAPTTCTPPNGTPMACADTPVLVAGPLSGKRLVAIDGSGRGFVARDADGVNYCWGNNQGGKCGQAADQPRFDSPQPLTPPAGKTYAAVTSGDRHSCGVTNDGKIYCWGFADHGQLGAAVVTGDCSGKACSVSPVLVAPAWSDAIKAVSVATGDDSSCAVAADGQAMCWGANGFGELSVSGGGDSPASVMVAEPK